LFNIQFIKEEYCRTTKFRPTFNICDAFEFNHLWFSSSYFLL